MPDGAANDETAATWLAEIRARRISAVELLEYFIDRCEARNPALNAVIRTDFSSARHRARELDAMAAKGVWAGPLHGLPMTVKDTFDVQGMPASAGAPEYASRPSNTPDAPAPARLRAAGAVIWGKTNTPYLAGDNQTSNPVHGLTRNPWSLAHTPGGSSGGAAAALAAGVTTAELGSDIGGSLRIPAHFCGVAALKPSFGRVPILGHVPPRPGAVTPRDLNVAGPMARNCDDLALLFRTLADEPRPAPRLKSLSGMRIGLWASEKSFPLSTACAGAVETAAAAAVERGAHIAVVRPGIDGPDLLDLYLRLLLPILAADMPPGLVRAMQVGRPVARLLARREPFSRSKWALYSASTHVDWLEANEARERLKLAMASFFTNWSAILAPVAPSPAFEHIDKGDSVTRKLLVDGKPTPYSAFHGWIALATICHLPAVTIPVAVTPEGLPVGAQIIGAPDGDEALLEIARQIEAELGPISSPPAHRA